MDCGVDMKPFQLVCATNLFKFRFDGRLLQRERYGPRHGLRGTSRTLALALLFVTLTLSGCLQTGSDATDSTSQTATDGGITSELEPSEHGSGDDSPDGLSTNSTRPNGSIEPTKLTITVDEPAAGHPAQITIVAAGDPVTIRYRDQNLSSDAGPMVFHVPTTTPGQYNVSLKVANSTMAWSESVAFDAWGERPGWFDEEPTDEHTVRPGTRSNGCTTNFLYHYKHFRYFIGSAAHCADGDNPMPGDAADYCGNRIPDQLGTPIWIEGLGPFGEPDTEGTLAYHGWASISPVRDQYPEPWCPANDFALLEIPPHHWHKMHPKGYGIIGDVTGIDDCSQWGGSMGDFAMVPVKAYGRSSLRHPDVFVSSNANGPDHPADDKTGYFLHPAFDGMKCTYYFATPAIFGDSGGPVSSMDGKALGAAATINSLFYPGANDYTNIYLALQLMEDIEGWAPEIVTSA